MTACRTHPERTLYLAFGHDEEVGGDLGAGAIASLLASRGVTLDFVVDEGGPILVDGLPSLLRTPTQIALVGTAEKVRHGITVLHMTVITVSASQLPVEHCDIEVLQCNRVIVQQGK